jgi:hypothetical protein
MTHWPVSHLFLFQFVTLFESWVYDGIIQNLDQSARKNCTRPPGEILKGSFNDNFWATTQSGPEICGKLQNFDRPVRTFPIGNGHGNNENKVRWDQ